jgi:hypothetical protein
LLRHRGCVGTTNRTFVREGQNEGHISIRLNNRGAEAYKKDLYGDAIVIVRTLKKAGGTSYKIKSATGSIVSQKADEVKQICDAFNIQVRALDARSCSVSVEHIGRQSVRNFDARHQQRISYHSVTSTEIQVGSLRDRSGLSRCARRFFLQATQLQLSEENYQKTVDQVQLTEEALTRQEAQLPALEQAFQVRVCVEMCDARAHAQCSPKGLVTEYKEKQHLEKLAAEIDQKKAEVVRLCERARFER